MNAGEQAAKLIESPECYDDFKYQYRSRFEYFRSLRNNAPSNLTFSEYIELHRIFLDHDTTGKIQEFVEDTLHRSLRNMITGGSRRGRAYAVESLSELEDCRRQFATLSVDTPSLDTVIDTLLESLYDNDWTRTVETSERLLQDTTGCPEALVNYLARVYATALIDHERDLELSRDVYRSISTPRVENAPATAGACLDAALGLPYKDDKRTAFIQTALHRDGVDLTVFVDFLCESAIDDIETARHDYEQSDRPSRGELGFTMFQLAVVENCKAAELDDEQTIRLRAYQRVAAGLIASGGYWISHRDTPPEPNFSQAAVDYVCAARLLKDIQLKRSITYLSKSYRMLAHTATSFTQTREIHEECIDALITCTKEGSSTADRVLNKRLTSLAQFHRLEILKIRVLQAYRNHRYNTVLSLFDECKELCDGCDHPAADLTDIQAVTDIAKGVAAEHNDNFEMAAIQFEGAKEASDTAPVEFSQNDFTDRANISGFKASVLDNEYEAARTCVKSCTRDCDLLFAALNALMGDPVESVGYGDINRLPGINSGATRVLRMVVDTHELDNQISETELTHAISRI